MLDFCLGAQRSSGQEEPVSLFLSLSLYLAFSLSRSLSLDTTSLSTPRKCLESGVENPWISSRKKTSSVYTYATSSLGVVRKIAYPTLSYALEALSSDDVFQQISARYRAVKPEQWLQRHPEAGSPWPSWTQASHRLRKRDMFSVVPKFESGELLVWGRPQGSPGGFMRKSNVEARLI